MAEEPVLIVDRGGSVARVTLNRPGRLNALSAEMLDALRDTWAELARSPSLRCVIVTGAGRGFCAGADIELLASSRDSAPVDVHEELAFLPGAHLAVPVIAAVNGPCVGGGLHFVADADVVIAGAAASFSDPHVNAGQVSALEPLTLALRVRADELRKMVLLGSAYRLDAEQARAAGLVSEVVPDERLLGRADELAEMVCAGSPAAVAASRDVLRRFEHAIVESQLQQGWDAIRAHWDHPDATEGPAAFAEKRSPVWRSTPS